MVRGPSATEPRTSAAAPRRAPVVPDLPRAELDSSSLLPSTRRFRSRSYTPAIHSSIGITAAIAAPSSSSRIRLVTGDTRLTPSVAPPEITATRARAVYTASTSQARSGYHRHSRTATPVGIADCRRHQRPGAPPLGVEPRAESAHDRHQTGHDQAVHEEMPLHHNSYRPHREDQGTRVRNPISSRLARRLRSVSRAAESGTEAMIACQVCGLLSTRPARSRGPAVRRSTPTPPAPVSAAARSVPPPPSASRRW